jgi:hypothetical protein
MATSQKKISDPTITSHHRTNVYGGAGVAFCGRSAAAPACSVLCSIDTSSSSWVRRRRRTVVVFVVVVFVPANGGCSSASSVSLPLLLLLQLSVAARLTVSSCGFAVCRTPTVSSPAAAGSCRAAERVVTVIVLELFRKFLSFPSWYVVGNRYISRKRF